MVIKLLIGSAVLVLLLFAIDRIPIRYNLRNLSVRWKTTLMTAMAFTLVIALLTVMMGFVNGMQRLTDGTGQPGNVLIMADGATDEVFSNLSVGDLAEIETQPGIVRENGRPLASRETYFIVNQPVPNAAAGQPKRRFVQMRGIDDPLLTSRVHNLQLHPGGAWFSDAGVQQSASADAAAATDAGQTAIQAVVGEGVARELGRYRSQEELAAARNPKRLDVGDAFVLGNRTWVITGVMKSLGSTFDSEIWAKRSLIAALFGKNTYTTLVVRTASAAGAQEFCNFLKEKYSKAAVAAQVETDYYASMSETNKQFSWAIGFVAVVLSIGGVFGVMNTMFAAISQRTKDIGVLRLMGYTRRQVLVSFLLESIVIALLGGLLGCALGSLADGWTATSVVAGSAGGGKSVVVQLAVDAPIAATGILLTLLMGSLGGLLPALSAIRLKPLEALR
jgi:putative ABC transport system permease protein